MSRPSLFSFLASFILLLGISGPTAAQRYADSLQGLASLTVEVIELPAPIRNAGLREHLVRQRVERSLLFSGLSVQATSASRLRLEVKCLPARNDGFAVFTLNLQLLEPALLLREVRTYLSQDKEILPELASKVVAWEATAFGYIRQYADPLPILYEAIDGKIAQFLSDLDQADPKSAAPPVAASAQVEQTTPTSRPSLTIWTEAQEVIIEDSQGQEIFRGKLHGPEAAPQPLQKASPSAGTTLQDRFLRSFGP